MSIALNGLNNKGKTISWRWRGAMAIAVLAGLMAAGVEAPRHFGARSAFGDDADEAARAREQLKQATDLSKGFQYVAKAARPSVVNITLSQKARGMRGLRFGDQGPEGFASPFDDFLNRFLGENPQGIDPRQPRRRAPRGPQGEGGDERMIRRGMGSGIVATADGIILTNNHVVADADEIEVKLWDGRTHKAKVLGADAKTDIAVIKIEATGLIPAALGNSDALEVGEWAIAVGSPLGLEQTVTSGIISAKGRSYAPVESGNYEDFIQTDAAINMGNSGGPLLNLQGEVIGINAAIASHTGGYMGIGFAVPINMAKAVMDSIVKHGRVTRGYLGVEIGNVQGADEGLRDSLGYKGNDGVFVKAVGRGTPADKAGLLPRDVIMKLDGRPVENVNHLRGNVGSTEPGTKRELEIWRDGETKTVQIVVAELEGGGKIEDGAGEDDASAPKRSFDLGASVETLTTDKADRMGLGGTEGALVMEVEPGSAAANAGIQPDDVIVKVGSTPIKTAEGFREAVKKADVKQGVTLWIVNEKGRRFELLKE